MAPHLQHQLSRYRKAAARARRGFTLVEIVVVLGIMLIIAALVLPMFRGMGSGAQFNRAVMEIRGLVETARQTAVTQNSVTWLGMGVTTDAGGQKVLHVAVMISKEGGDPSPWSSYGTVPNSLIGLATQTRFFKGVLLSDAATFGQAQVPTLPATPVSAADNSLSLDTAVFTLSNPDGNVQLNRVVQFTPSGEVRTSESPAQIVEFALQPQLGATAAGDAKNIAVFRISGITGQCSVYRP